MWVGAYVDKANQECREATRSREGHVDMVVTPKSAHSHP